MENLKVLELFGGIGACSNALKKLNIPFEIVDYVEIDKFAVKSFNAIYGTNFEPQDICEYDKNIDVDLIMHGSPCQDFSLAGKQAGGDKDSGTRSSLMYETLRIVEKSKPKYVIWENVKNVLSKKHRHNFDNYLNEMEQLGYKNYYQVLNAKDYGIPQNRERVFTISIRNDIENEMFFRGKMFEFPPKQELKLKLKDMLEDEVDDKYYLSEKTINFFYKNEQIQKEKGNGFRFGVSDGNVIAKAVTTRAGSRMDDNFLKIKNNTKKGYLKAYEGDGIYTNTSNKRGTVQHGMIQTLTTFQDKGVVVKNKIVDDRDKGWGIKISDICPTQRATRSGIKYIDDDLHIRKLTPKECWRLMGFSNEDFEKASKVNSNTQLYKQAGNSIVVNVLVEIFKNLLLGEK